MTAPPQSDAQPALRAGRPEAAAAIWDRQREVEAPVDFPALARRNRLRGLAQALGAGAIGGAMWAFGIRTPAMIVFTVASVVGFSALVAPTSLYSGIERGFAGLGRLTGQALGWILLVPVFYLVFAPFRILLRRGRRDRLQRTIDPDAATYWEPHEGMRTASDSYLRQF